MANIRRSTALKSLKYSSRCPACQISAKNPALHKRILASTKFSSIPGAETLKDIAKAYKLGYHNFLGTHIAKHVALNPDEMSTNEMKRIAERAEVKSTIMQYDAGVKATDVWDDVITQAREGLKDGSIKLNANHLLKAAKDKTDFEIKKKNQDMAIQEMMWHFASGEAKGSTEYDRRVIEGEAKDDYDPTAIFAGLAPEGPSRPSDIHSGTTGDAPTPRTDQVLEGDDF